MFIAGFPAGSFQANCYLIAREAGASALVVDPGEDALEQLAATVTEHGLRPVAVLLTHGHLDHAASVPQVCAAYDIPVWLHADDDYMLDDPLAALSPELRRALADRPIPSLRPADVGFFADGDLPGLADLPFTVDHTPGHTGGSVVLRLDAAEGRPEVLFTGDTLFAGSIGRSDLPGGSAAVLNNSLAAKLLTRDDGAIVLPGHGPTSSIGAERRSNPYLQDL